MQRASQWCTTTQHFSNFPKDCLKQALAHGPKAPWNSYFRFRGPVSLCRKQTQASAIALWKQMGVHTLKYPCLLTAKFGLPMLFIMEYFCFSLSFIHFCVYVCVWMCVCEFCIVQTRVHSWAFAYGNQRRTSGILVYCLIPQRSSCLCWHDKLMQPAWFLFCFALKAGARDWNSGPHAHRAKTLPCWAISSTQCCSLSFCLFILI